MSTTFRLEWPHWQGGEPQAVAHYTPGLTPTHDGPTARASVPAYVEELPIADGIVGRDEVHRQHDEALGLLRDAAPDRVLTLAGTCAVSLAPFSHHVERHADDLAVIWLDGHAESNVPGGRDRGFNTMVVSHLSGRGDSDVSNSDEHAFGMAWEKDAISISIAIAMRTIAAVADESDLVGLTVPEFVHREASVLRSVLRRLPLTGAGTVAANRGD